MARDRARLSDFISLSDAILLASFRFVLRHGQRPGKVVRLHLVIRRNPLGLLQVRPPSWPETGQGCQTSSRYQTQSSWPPSGSSSVMARDRARLSDFISLSDAILLASFRFVLRHGQRP